jgi:putative glutathione S-transferase
MQTLINGTWWPEFPDTTVFQAFRREQAQHLFRGAITPEAGRYHLYVSHGCPRSHQIILQRRFKKLEDAISMTSLSPAWGGPQGWSFTLDEDGEEAGGRDPVTGAKHLYQLYQRARPRYSGEARLPVLWDKRDNVLVNNNAEDILRLLNDTFGERGGAPDLHPNRLLPEISTLSIFARVNLARNLFETHFAATRQARETAARAARAALAHLERHFQTRRFACGEQVTDVDWRLFTALSRLDAMAETNATISLGRLADFAHLDAYVARIMALPGVRETVKPDHIIRFYRDMAAQHGPWRRQGRTTQAQTAQAQTTQSRTAQTRAA